MDDQLSESDYDQPTKDHLHSVLTLKTPLTKVLKDKVRCVTQYDVVQGALDFNSYLMKNMINSKDQLDQGQYIHCMQLLELNLKKLANYADESIGLRQYTFEDDELISAQIKGVINETRANKFAFNDPRIRQD